MEYIKKSNRIGLRHTEIRDLGFVIEAERDSENAQYVAQWTREQHENALSNLDVMHLIIEDLDTSKLLGYVIMAGLENLNHTIEFRRIVICEKGQGFGKETLNLVKQIAFEDLHVHRLWLDVRYKNERAQKVYKSVGFVEEGVLRECIFYNGNYESLIVMSVLRSEYMY